MLADTGAGPYPTPGTEARNGDESEEDFGTLAADNHDSAVRRLAQERVPRDGRRWVPIARDLALSALVALMAVGAYLLIVDRSVPGLFTGDFFSTAAGALLTLAGLVPAVIGIMVAGKASTRLDSGRVLWKWRPLVFSLAWASAAFAAIALSLLVLVGFWSRDATAIGLVGAAVLTLTLLVVVSTPIPLLEVGRRLGARTSSTCLVRTALRLSSTGTGRVVGPLLKDLRDAAIQEGTIGDRRACNERLIALGVLAASLKNLDEGLSAIDELGVVGAALVRDKEQALAVLALLGWIADTREASWGRTGSGPHALDREALYARLTTEAAAVWSASLERSGSPTIGERASGLVADWAGKSSLSRLCDALSRVLDSAQASTTTATTVLQIRSIPPASFVRADKKGRAVLRLPAGYLEALESQGQSSMESLFTLATAANRGKFSSTPSGAEGEVWRTLARVSTATSAGGQSPIASSARESVKRLMTSGNWRLAFELAKVALALPPPESRRPDEGDRRGALLAEVLHGVLEFGDLDALRAFSECTLGSRKPAGDRLWLSLTEFWGASADSVTAVLVNQASRLEAGACPFSDEKSVMRAILSLMWAREYWRQGDDSNTQARRRALTSVRRLVRLPFTSWSTWRGAVETSIKLVAADSQDLITQEGLETGLARAYGLWPLLLTGYSPDYTVAWCALASSDAVLAPMDLGSGPDAEVEGQFLATIALAFAAADDEGGELRVTQMPGEWFGTYKLTQQEARAGAVRIVAAAGIAESKNVPNLMRVARGEITSNANPALARAAIIRLAELCLRLAEDHPEAAAWRLAAFSLPEHDDWRHLAEVDDWYAAAECVLFDDLLTLRAEVRRRPQTRQFVQRQMTLVVDILLFNPDEDRRDASRPDERLVRALSELVTSPEICSAQTADRVLREILTRWDAEWQAHFVDSVRSQVHHDGASPTDAALQIAFRIREAISSISADSHWDQRSEDSPAARLFGVALSIRTVLRERAETTPMPPSQRSSVYALHRRLRRMQKENRVPASWWRQESRIV